jgi:hypothetical protein
MPIEHKFSAGRKYFQINSECAQTANFRYFLSLDSKKITEVKECF